MNKKLIGMISALALTVQCFTGAVMTASADSANLCKDGTFEEYTLGNNVPDSPNGYWKYWGEGGTATYSAGAAYGEGSNVGVKVVKTSDGTCQFNLDLSGFAVSKTYRIEFDEKLTGPVTDGVAAETGDWMGRFKMLDNGWGYMFTDGTQNNEIWLTPNEWTHYSFTLGPDGSESDHIIEANASDGTAHLTFELYGNGELNVDNFSIVTVGEEEKPEIPGTPLLSDSTFETYTDGTALPKEAGSYIWRYYDESHDAANSAIFSSSAKHGTNSNIGIAVTRANGTEVQLNNDINNFDPTRTYRISFSANANNKSWAGRFKIKNTEYDEILSGGAYDNGIWMSNNWEDFSFTVGPFDSGAEYVFDPEDVINDTVTLQFAMADDATLYIDNFQIERLEDGKILETALSWEDANGTTTTLSEGDIKGVATVFNKTVVDIPMQMIIAKYDVNGKLIDTSLAAASTISASQTEASKIYFPYTYTNTGAGEYLKVFAWGTTSNQKPFAASKPLQ